MSAGHTLGGEPSSQPPDSAASAFVRASRQARAERHLATRRRFIAGSLGTLTVGALASVAGASSALARSDAASGYSLPTYLSRKDWGCDESLSKGPDGKRLFPVVFYGVQRITVHHTASWTPWSRDEAIDLVQTVYRQHTVDQEFGDIGYHLLIDTEGTVYEGRYSGGTRFPIYDVHPSQTTGAPKAVNAAHTYQYNAGNIGIAMLGDMDDGGFTDAAAWSLELVLAMIAANTGVRADGKSHYDNPVTHKTHDGPNICGHQHFAQTSCPGENVLNYLSHLRSGARELSVQFNKGTWLA